MRHGLYWPAVTISMMIRMMPTTISPRCASASACACQSAPPTIQRRSRKSALIFFLFSFKSGFQSTLTIGIITIMRSLRRTAAAEQERRLQDALRITVGVRMRGRQGFRRARDTVNILAFLRREKREDENTHYWYLGRSDPGARRFQARNKRVSRQNFGPPAETSSRANVTKHKTKHEKNRRETHES